MVPNRGEFDGEQRGVVVKTDLPSRLGLSMNLLFVTCVFHQIRHLAGLLIEIKVSGLRVKDRRWAEVRETEVVVLV